jgi:iron complex outermembrane recepter protein
MRFSSISLLLISTCFFVVNVSAAETANGQRMEEIVVTAEFRDRTVLDTAASASVVEPNKDGTTVQHLEEVLAQIPNVNFASGASRARFIQIRGVGERSQFSDPLNSSVGLLVDGVDLSGLGTAATLFDVAQVEVLRGPQGTLYGANALAGLINVVTPAPTPEHSALLQLDAGDYDALGVGAVVSGPMGSQAGYRISVQRYEDDGFMQNDFLGKDDTSNRQESTYRGKFTWQADAALLTLSLGRIDVDNGYDAFSLDNDRTTLSDQPGQDQQQTNYAALSLAADLSASVAFEGLLSFADSDIDYGYDEDWTFTGFDPVGYTSTDRYQRSRKTGTVDLRWLSQPGQGFGEGTWDWVLGVYLLDQAVDLDRDYTFAAGRFSSEYDVNRYAVYSEIGRQLNAQWRLSLGARYEQHQSEYDDISGLSYSPKDDLFGGRIVLEYALDQGGLVYGSITQGYKAGGFNLDGSLSAAFREFDPENLWNVELGYKAMLWQDRLEVRAALFRMQRRDVQISTSRTVPIAGQPGAEEFIVFTGNAADGFNQGLELETTLQLTERLTAFANVGLLDSEYSDYVDQNGNDLDGREQAHAPSYQFFAGLQWDVSERWSARVEVEGKDEYYFSASHAERSDAYELINASLTYSAAAWQARLWARNLGDEDYFVRGFFFGNDPRDGYTDRVFTQLGEPRQVGITLTMNW